MRGWSTRAGAATVQRLAWAAMRSTGTAFRYSADDARPVRTSEELQELLRRRLRLISTIVACTTGSLALVAGLIRYRVIAAAPATLFTEPPLPGALLLLALVAGALVWALAPGQQSGIPRLRTIEWFGVATTVVFFVVNQALALR